MLCLVSKLAIPRSVSQSRLPMGFILAIGGPSALIMLPVRSKLSRLPIVLTFVILLVLSKASPLFIVFVLVMLFVRSKLSDLPMEFSLSLVIEPV